MKKLLFLLITSAAFAWSANCGDLGYGCTAYGASGYGSTAYGSTAYGSTAYGSSAYGATAYGSTAYNSSGSEAKNYGVNGYCVAAPVAKPAAPAPKPKATPAKVSETPAQVTLVPVSPVNSHKKYGTRLSMFFGYMTWENEYISKPLGIDFDMALTFRSGGDHLFVEYGLGVALMGMYYHFERESVGYDYSYDYYYDYYYGYYPSSSYSEVRNYYESQQGWLQIGLDAQLYLGLEIWRIILRSGAYGGYVIGPEPANKIVNPDPYGRDNFSESAYKYHYGTIGMFAIRLTEGFELNMQSKIDLSRFSEEYPGYFTVGIGMGFLF